MINLVGRGVAKLREWLGLDDPADHRLHPAHGWLLPPVPVRVPVTAGSPADPTGRRD